VCAELPTFRVGFKTIMSYMDFVSTGYAWNMLAVEFVGSVVDPGEVIFRQRDSFRKGPILYSKNWHRIRTVFCESFPRARQVVKISIGIYLQRPGLGIKKKLAFREV
jgi:hypothetical protein